MDIYKIVGINIEAFRKENNETIHNFSKILKMDSNRYNSVITGKVKYNLETLAKISKNLNIPLKRLFDNVTYDEEIGLYEDGSYDIKPFVKWAGGKTQLMGEIVKRLPENYGTFYEPFVGGGSVFLSIQPSNVIVSDTNKELITAYNSIKEENKLNKLMKLLDEHEVSHKLQEDDYYYSVREIDRTVKLENMNDEEIAARFIYLNKAGFNGLYRVNQKGYFNVPTGKRAEVNTYDRKNLLELNKYFNKSNVKIILGSYEEVASLACENDFVYFDPPYDRIEGKASFTAYSKSDFNREDQKKLSVLFKELDKKGVKVMLSNHNTEYIRDLYEGFKIDIVHANRMINSNGSNRGRVEEVIITNY